MNQAIRAVEKYSEAVAFFFVYCSVNVLIWEPFVGIFQLHNRKKNIYENL